MKKTVLSEVSKKLQLESNVDEYRIDTSIHESIKKLIKHINKCDKKEDDSPGVIKTGFGNLTFRKGELNIIASKQNYLSTAFELSLINQISIKDNEKVGLFIPGNFNNIDLVNRLVSIISGVPDYRIAKGLFKEGDINKIEDACQELNKAPLSVYNEPNISIEQLEYTITDYVKAYKIKVAFIEGFDFIEELVDAKEKDYRENIFWVLDTLKRLAQKLNISIEVVMSLPKTENIEDCCNSSISDFKKYMIIPKKADRIFLISKNFYKTEPESQIAELMVTERFGIHAVGYILKFIASVNLFVNAEED